MFGNIFKTIQTSNEKIRIFEKGLENAAEIQKNDLRQARSQIDKETRTQFNQEIS